MKWDFWLENLVRHSYRPGQQSIHLPQSPESGHFEGSSGPFAIPLINFSLSQSEELLNLTFLSCFSLLEIQKRLNRKTKLSASKARVPQGLKVHTKHTHTHTHTHTHARARAISDHTRHFGFNE